jgi:DNA-binding transcriptional regulator GbsR (MarR family)
LQFYFPPQERSMDVAVLNSFSFFSLKFKERPKLKIQTPPQEVKVQEDVDEEEDEEEEEIPEIKEITPKVQLEKKQSKSITHLFELFS